MACKNLFVAIFIFSCVLTCKGEKCQTFDERGLGTAPCPENKVLYSAGCQDPTMSERTCRNPEARSLGVRCDYWRCECTDPNVWDEAAQKCVKLDECSDQSHVTTTDSD